MKASNPASRFVLAFKEGDGRPALWNIYPSLEAAEAAKAVIPLEAGDGIEAFEAMAWKDFLERQRRYYLREPEEITPEHWEESLGMLPPLHWEVACGVERFLCCEFLDGNYTRQYARLGTRYFMRIVDHGDPSTWITAEMLGALTHR